MAIIKISNEQSEQGNNSVNVEYGNTGIVPDVPKTVKEKEFGPSDIKWVKNVNDKVTNTAYLDKDSRIIRNPDGVFFRLQLKSMFRQSLKDVPIGGLILLYQRLNNQYFKCFTHLVTPIEDKITPDPNSTWVGRWVKVIAMTEREYTRSIGFNTTKWQNAGFISQPAYQMLTFMQSRVFTIPTYIEKYAELQKDIWDKFQPYVTH